MRIHEIITESLSSGETLYHITEVQNAASILSQRRFNLGNTVVDPIERKIQPGHKYYYFSTARSRLSVYIQKAAIPGAALFSLNARWLYDRYKTLPVDYFAARDWPMRHGVSEMETRIISKDHVIPLPKNVSDLINEIHLLVEDNRNQRIVTYDKPYVRSLIINSKRLGIPIFIYEDAKSFLSQNKSRAIPIRDIIPFVRRVKRYKDASLDARTHTSDVYKHFRELYYKTDESTLSPGATKILKGLRKADPNNQDDIAIAALPIIRLFRRHPESFARLLRIFSKEKINDPKDFIRLLMTKWKANNNVSS